MERVTKQKDRHTVLMLKKNRAEALPFHLFVKSTTVFIQFLL